MRFVSGAMDPLGRIIGAESLGSLLRSLFSDAEVV